jgi:hypothetical protein
MNGLTGFGDYKSDKKVMKKKIKRKMAKKSPKKEWYESLFEHATNLLPKLAPLLLGFGDYTVETNSIMAAGTDGEIGNEVPLIENSKCSNIIHMREYMGDVLSSTKEFQSQTFPINPGMSETFPWLCNIANNYEAYRLRGMVFEFVEEASSYANVAGLGYVAMSTQYNSLQEPFGDKKSMLNHEFASSRATNKSFIHPIECKKNQLVLSELYTRPGTPPNDSDLRFYDVGVLNLAVGGQVGDNQVIGELWNSYEIEFYVPKTSSTSGVNVAYFQAQDTAVTTEALPVLANSIIDPASNLGVTMSAGNICTFPNGTRGRFLVSVRRRNVGVPAASYDPVISTVNCTLAVVAPSWLIPVVPEVGALCIYQESSYEIDVLLDKASFKLTAAVPAAWNPAGVSLIITQIPRSQTMTVFRPKNFPEHFLPRTKNSEFFGDESEETGEDTSGEEEVHRVQLNDLMKIMSAMQQELNSLKKGGTPPR